MEFIQNNLSYALPPFERAIHSLKGLTISVALAAITNFSYELLTSIKVIPNTIVHLNFSSILQDILIDGLIAAALTVASVALYQFVTKKLAEKIVNHLEVLKKALTSETIQRLKQDDLKEFEKPLNNNNQPISEAAKIITPVTDLSEKYLQELDSYIEEISNTTKPDRELLNIMLCFYRCPSPLMPIKKKDQIEKILLTMTDLFLEYSHELLALAENQDCYLTSDASDDTIFEYIKNIQMYVIWILESHPHNLSATLSSEIKDIQTRIKWLELEPSSKRQIFLAGTMQTLEKEGLTEEMKKYIDKIYLSLLYTTEQKELLLVKESTLRIIRAPALSLTDRSIIKKLLQSTVVTEEQKKHLQIKLDYAVDQAIKKIPSPIFHHKAKKTKDVRR